MSPRPAQPPLTSWRRSLGIGAMLAAIVAVIMLAFSWPAVTSSISRLPIAIAGASAQVDAVESALDAAQPGAFDFTRVDNRDSAVKLIEHREAYGAIVLGQKPEVLTASAASTVVSSALGQVASALQMQSAQAAAAAGVSPPAVTVSDIVPLSNSDPRGVGLVAAGFPLTLGGMLGGILVSTIVVGAMRRFAAVTGYAALTGLALAGILQGWFGALQGTYIVNAAAIAVTVLAIAAPIVGMAALIGRIGIAFGPIVFLLLANPVSSATSPQETLPGSWGAIGQLFPPGAGSTLLRDLSYFPDATNLTQAWIVVALWATVGLLLLLAGHFRRAFKSDSRIAEQAFPAAVG